MRKQILSLFLVFCATAQSLDTTSSSVPRFFEDFAVTIDASMYALQKDSFFVERRLAQSVSNIELAMFRMGRFSSTWLINTHIGLGQTPGNVVFDVIDLDYSLVPTIGYRLDRFNLISGIDHRCFHEVDRKILRVAYWNKVHLVAQSHNARLFDFVNSVPRDESWNLQTHAAWSLQWGFFLKEFFGLVHPNKLNGLNGRSHELVFNGRVAAWQWRDLLVGLHGETVLGQQIGIAAQPFYWQQRIGTEFFYTGGKRGASMFVSYFLDDMPLQDGTDRWGRDRLLEFGIRFFE